MTQRREHADYLDDIEQAARKAVRFVQGMAFEQFASDDKTSFAVIRALEIIGEATKKVPQEARDLFPDLPWRSMAGIRDKLIHDYVNVNLEVVWKTVVEDLPGLIARLQGAREGSGEANAPQLE
jgi:uncharacterized protein with HEPN domain